MGAVGDAIRGMVCRPLCSPVGGVDSSGLSRVRQGDAAGLFLVAKSARPEIKKNSVASYHRVPRLSDGEGTNWFVLAQG